MPALSAIGVAKGIGSGLAWLFTSPTGRALLLIGALAGAVWWFGDSRYERGVADDKARSDAAMAAYVASVDAERLRSEREARAIEAKHRAEMHGVAVKYEQEKIDAQAAVDRTIADLRSGALRLRDEWAGCETSALVSRATTAAALPDGGAELRRQGAGDLVSIGEGADAQVRGLQAALRVCTGGGSG